MKKREDILFFILCLIATLSIFAGLFVTVSRENSKNIFLSAWTGEYRADGEQLRRKGSLPVKAAWEYYPGQHIISDAVPTPIPDKRIILPMDWNMFDADGWGGNGRASYLLRLTDLPPQEGLVLLFNGISANMTLYVNGAQTGFSGNNFNGNVVYIDHMDRCEVVIEVSSKWLSGIYAQPWLMTANTFTRYDAFESRAQMIFLGAFFTSFLFVIILLRKNQDKKKHWAFLRIFFCIGLFFLFSMIETSSKLNPIYQYISFEELHLVSTITAICLGLLGIHPELLFFPKLFHDKVLYFITASFLGSAFLRLFIGSYVNMDLSIICLAVVFLVYQVYCACAEFFRSKDLGVLYLVTSTLSIGCSIFISLFGFSYTAYTSSIMWVMLLIAVLFYVNFWSAIFAENERAAKRENESKQNQIDAEIAYLSSQIQPHFQYNILAMIQELCYTDPQKAADAIVLYSSFLRRRIDFEKLEKLVPFSEELASIHEYIQLQELRFGDQIRFEPQVETTDFFIPPLSLQTLVENAVHHGLRKTKEGGGTVRIQVKGFEDKILILITDNGVGFDLNILKDCKGSGLNNSCFRIQNLTGGKVRILSEPGKGTEIQIILPAISNERKTT